MANTPSLSRSLSWCVLFLLFIATLGHSKRAPSKFLDNNEDLDRLLEQKIAENYPQISPGERRTFLELLKSHEQEIAASPSLQSSRLKARQIPTFDCTPFPPSPVNPTSVNQLRPGDIKVIGAMGDSLTAGFGALAEWIWDMFTEYRGASWSIGGDHTVDRRMTLPNMLKAYNPNLIGFSTRTGDVNTRHSDLNRAVTGSRAPAMLSQAQSLIDRMRAHPNVSMENDWKMVTIWVGSNDLCDICSDRDQLYSPDAYEANIKAAVKLLKDNVPKLFINLIQGINPAQLYDVRDGLCPYLHMYECPCGASGDANVRAEVTKRLAEYNKRLIVIANDTSLMANDFTIVIQPFLSKTSIPTKSNGQIDMSYFALDCFHFSGLSHAAAAVGIWNNLFQRVNYKTEEWTPGEPIICPTADQFISTVQNSL